MEETIKKLREKSMQLPLEPGVYIMYDKDGKVIYIGKAKMLKNRVSQYFGSQRNHAPKVLKMVSCVEKFDYIVTDSEFEALILECSLIKQYKPKYNILLKDDKGYSYIKVTNEDWPKISFTFHQKDDGATYIGPYMSSFAVKQAVDEARKVFMLPTCNKKFPQDIGKGRPCLNFYIQQCCAPCSNNVTQEEYKKAVKDAVDFLKNGDASVVARLNTEMQEAAENLEFEKAAALRDKLNALKKLKDKQKVVAQISSSYDVIAHMQDHNSTCFVVFRYDNGKLTNKEHFVIDVFSEAEEMMQEFIERYYSSRESIPKKILVDVEFNASVLEEWLTGLAKRKVSISFPKKGEAYKLITMCRENAAEQLRWGKGRSAKELANLEELSKLLNMDRPPEYIEMYDISNMAGDNNVAGMVVFQNGRPLKSAYRKFKIKTVIGQDDYASMAEVIDRRLTEYENAQSEDGFGKLPDLILLDGGRGHVSAIKPVLEKHRVNIPLFGVVKDGKHRTRAIAMHGGEIALSTSRGAFKLLSDIQDEVHRFAISFHKQQRKKNTLQLTLTKVEGVGEKKAASLIKHFKTMTALKKADVSEICAVKGINENLAKKIREYLDEN